LSTTDSSADWRVFFERDENVFARVIVHTTYDTDDEIYRRPRELAAKVNAFHHRQGDHLGRAGFAGTPST
jgi:hypothetical protein